MEKYPEKDIKDYAYDSTKAGLNLIPIVGGSLTTIFETVFSAPIDKRKQDWLKLLAKTVEELCETVENLTPEKLSENPEFVSFYLQASNIAIRTHNEEKLEILNNAVKNCILMSEVHESKKMIFLRILDLMTPLHIKLLHFLANPEQYISKLNNNLPENTHRHWGDLRTVWDELGNEIRSSDPLVDLAFSDLKNYGLIFVDKFHNTQMNSCATGLGNEFINFTIEMT